MSIDTLGILHLEFDRIPVSTATYASVPCCCFSGKLLDLFQPHECANYFGSCSYDPN